MDEEVVITPLASVPEQSREAVLPTLLEGLTEKQLLDIASYILNVVFKLRGSGKELPNSFLDKALIACLTLDKCRAVETEDNLVFLLLRALSSVQMESEHLPTDSLAFGTIELILKSLFSTKAIDFHSTARGQMISEWLKKSCEFVPPKETAGYLEHVSNLFFPWNMQRYFVSNDDDDGAQRLMLGVNASYVEVREEQVDNLAKQRMGLILVSEKIELGILKQCGTAKNQQHEIVKSPFKSVKKEEIETINWGVTSIWENRFSEEPDVEEMETNHVEMSPQKQTVVQIETKDHDYFKPSPVIQKCELCEMNVLASKIDVHMTRYHKDRSMALECNVCQEEFVTWEEKRDHMTRHKQTCDVCLFVLPPGIKIKSHKQLHHRSPVPIKCLFCASFFSNRWEMRLHVYREHKKIRPHCCHECYLLFRTESAMTDHKKLVHACEEVSYLCTHCSDKFPSRNAVIKHMRLKHPQRFANVRYECESCKKLFRSKLKLKYHKVHVHKEELDITHRCGICAQEFPSKNQLGFHRAKEHSRQFCISCPVCSNSFSTSKEMREHYTVNHDANHAISTGQFKCAQCERFFETDEALKQHCEILHVKDFACSVCAEKFKSKNGLETHMGKHAGGKQYLCEECGKSFDSKMNCRRHVINSHKKTLEERRRSKKEQCEKCGQQFTDKYTLNIHVERVHKGNANFARVMCPYCHKILANRTKLDSHVKSLHRGATSANVVQCDVCQKMMNKSSLKTHRQQVHGLDTTAFRCDKCYTYFVSEGGLDAHGKSESRKQCTKLYRQRLNREAKEAKINGNTLNRNEPKTEQSGAASETAGQKIVYVQFDQKTGNLITSDNKDVTTVTETNIVESSGLDEALNQYQQIAPENNAETFDVIKVPENAYSDFFEGSL